MKIEIKRIEKVNRVGNDTGVLEVESQITDGETGKTKIEEFPLDTPQEVIQASVDKALELYKSEKELAEKNAKVEEDNKNADEVIKNLSDYTNEN